MKTQLTLICTLLAAITATAGVPLRWTVETSRVQPAVFDVVRGETIELEASFTSYGKPVATTNQTAFLAWQTNGMDAAWWVTNATTAAANRARAVFTPEMDPGAATLTGFIGLSSSTNLISSPNLSSLSSLSYRAAFTLRFRRGPGARVNALPLPAKVIDCAKVTFLNPTNAPWATGGGGGVDTNAVREIVAEEMSGKIPNQYTWVRPDDWTISYVASNTSRTVKSAYAEIDGSHKVISNLVQTVNHGRGGTAYLTILDPNSNNQEGIDSFFAVDSGITIDATSGAFSTTQDGFYKIGARRSGEVRYTEVASQIVASSKETTISYYADDEAGTTRKAVNDAAYSILTNATLMGTNVYVKIVEKGGIATTNRLPYSIYKTFQPRMTSTRAGNVTPFAVSKHILSSVMHYGEGIRWLWDQTFNDGNGNTSVVNKLQWIGLADWAATNGFSEAEISYAKIDDLAMIVCSTNTAVPEGCIPHFMNEAYMKDVFGESMRGVCAWSHVQDLTNAIPVVMVDEHHMRKSPQYYYKYKDPDTGQEGFSRADVCRRLEQMGQQYYVHSGDSGKPVFVNIDGKPVILTTWGWSDGSGTAYGANYVRGYKIIKAFVESYGDTLKGLEK